MAQSPLRENSVIAWPSILYHLLHSEFTKSETPHSVVALLLSTSQLGISAGYGRLFGSKRRVLYHCETERAKYL